MNLLLECLVGLLLLLGCVLFTFVASPYLLAYLATPLGLYGLHIAGEYLQATDQGPLWMQNHLHNVGLASGALLLVLVASLSSFKPDKSRPFSAHQKMVGEQFMRLTPWVLGAATAIFIATELVIVGLFRLELEVSGYSGRVDIRDILAYLLGFVLVLISHVTLRPYVRRKAAWQ